MMFSAYKLRKQGDNIQPCHTCLTILNQSVVPCRVLSAASCPTNRFLRRQMRMSGIPVSWRSQFVVIQTVKGFTTVNEAEVDVFLEFPCFLYDPSDVGNLISGSSAFCKPSIENCKYYFLYIIYEYIYMYYIIMCTSVTHNFYQYIMDESKENIDFDWQRGWECGSNLLTEKGEGRCLEGGPSLHQNHLELLQKTEIHPCVLRRSSGAFQEKKTKNKKQKNRFQFAQIWENRKVLLK